MKNIDLTMYKVKMVKKYIDGLRKCGFIWSWSTKYKFTYWK